MKKNLRDASTDSSNFPPFFFFFLLKSLPPPHPLCNAFCHPPDELSLIEVRALRFCTFDCLSHTCHLHDPFLAVFPQVSFSLHWARYALFSYFHPNFIASFPSIFNISGLISILSLPSCIRKVLNSTMQRWFYFCAALNYSAKRKCTGKTNSNWPLLINCQRSTAWYICCWISAMAERSKMKDTLT